MGDVLSVSQSRLYSLSLASRSLFLYRCRQRIGICRIKTPLPIIIGQGGVHRGYGIRPRHSLPVHLGGFAGAETDSRAIVTAPVAGGKFILIIIKSNHSANSRT